MSAKRHAQGDSLDYTPPAAMIAGDMVKVGDFLGVAENDIPANIKGALAVNGVFRISNSVGTVTLGAEYDVNVSAGTAVAAGAGDASIKVFAAADGVAADAEVPFFINKVG